MCLKTRMRLVHSSSLEVERGHTKLELLVHLHNREFLQVFFFQGCKREGKAGRDRSSSEENTRAEGNVINKKVSKKKPSPKKPPPRRQ
jgi:hypothetical protein